MDQRAERRRGSRRPPRAHPRHPGRPDVNGAHQLRVDAGVSLGLLVRAAEADLIARWREARRRGQQESQALSGFLLEANESVARRGAARYRPHRLARTDVAQAARLGLLRAMERFDATARSTFGTYAFYWVRKEVQRAVAEGEFAVTVPAHLSGRLLATGSLLRAEPGIELRELGERLGVGRSVAAGLVRLARVADLPVEDEPDGHADSEEWVTAATVRDALEALPGNLRAVVAARFGFDGAGPRSGRQVARELGVSEFTVRSRLRRALADLEPRLGD